MLNSPISVMAAWTVDVTTGAELLAVGRDEQGAHRRIAGNLRNRCVKRPRHGQIEHIGPAWIIEGDDRERVIPFDDERCG